MSNLQLWLRADVGVYSDAGVTPATEGQSVRQWNDQSGNGRNFTGAVKKPVFRAAAAALDNAPALEYAGNKDYLYDDDGESYINGMTAFTTFMVIKSDLTGTNNGFIISSAPSGVDQYFTMRYDAVGDIGAASNVIRTSILANSSANQIESAADFQTTNGQILGWEWQSGTKYNLYVDGVLNNPSHSAAPPSGTIASANILEIGRGSQNSNNSWDGLIAEVIIYNRTLTNSERISIEDYLSQKYGISVRLLDPATGGEEISADDANTNYTILSGPRITEDVLGELALGGTIVLTLPSGYEWNTGGSDPTVTINPAYGTATTLSVSYTSRTTTQVTFTVDAISTTPNKPGEMVIGNLQVRPTTGILPNSGEITNTGTTGPTGDTNFGTLTMVAGTAAKLTFVQQPVTTNIDAIITPAPTIQVRDQYNNAVDTTGINIGMTLTTGTGTLSGTTPKTTSATGLASFSDLAINATGTKRLTASSGTLTAAESNDFTITSLGVFTTFLVERESGGNILTQTAGQTFNIKISAVDGSQVLDASFDGTVDITSDGTLGTGSGTTASFSGGILASHTVSILNTGTFSITATNSAGSESGSSNSFTVNPGVADPTTTTITADPAILVNDGASTATITVQVKDVQGNNLTSGGAAVNLLTDAGTLLGSVSDNGNGTYTQLLQSSISVETATVTGLLNSVGITDNAQVMFNQYT
ncbi:MAG: invasin domain 3-containing protein, partial [Candidatus Neomarinimicrobiota bacterium]